MERLAELHAVAEDRIVKGFGETEHCFVLHLVFLVNADDVLHSCFFEDFAHELRMTRRNEDELEVTLGGTNQFFELVTRD